jgi:hypothetical protein
MLPVSPEIGARLPFTFAYLVMCLCLYSFVRRRYPVGYALAALLYPLHHLIFYYATEARAYALVLAGAGVAMLSWQSAAIGRHRRWSLIGLWLGLAFAVNAHAFAIFLIVPFALAQFFQDFKQKKRDWAIWAAIVLFPVGILPVLHGEMLAGKVYGTHFWSQPDIQSIFISYQDFFFSYRSYPAVLLLIAISAALLQRRSQPRVRELQRGGFSLPELVLATSLALLPVYVVPASFLLHIYNPRYVVSCNIGLILIAIAAVAESARRSRLAGVTLFALFLLASIHHRVVTIVDGCQALVHPDRVHEQLQTSFNNLPWVKLLEQSRLPVVADWSNIYGEFDYYTQPELQHRLNGVTENRNMKKYVHFTTFEFNLLCFRKLLSYRVAEIEDFISEHPHFLLVEKPVKTVWMPRYLYDQQAAGTASYKCIGPDCAGTGINVYDVFFTKLPVLPEIESKPDSIPIH